MLKSNSELADEFIENFFRGIVQLDLVLGRDEEFRNGFLKVIGDHVAEKDPKLRTASADTVLEMIGFLRAGGHLETRVTTQQLNAMQGRIGELEALIEQKDLAIRVLQTQNTKMKVGISAIR